MNDIGTWPVAPKVWLGTNYWSRSGGPRMWANYDGDVVREELATLASLGCTLTRSFCFWPDFMPAPETLDEEVLERFGDFLDLHAESGLKTIPTFLVGHMSGQNWPVPWQGDKDLYRDVWLVGQQAWFARALASRYASHDAIAGWLLSNEMPIFGGAGDVDYVTAWAQLLVDALRAGGATQPVSTGDGAWGIETSGRDNGFSLRRLASCVDFIGPHVYLSTDDPVRQMLSAAFACELSAVAGKPVVLEEFGLSSDMVSGENAAHYYRVVLHSSLAAGARGWLAWNNCDYDTLAAQEPYRHHAFEMHFGITDRSGRPKPQARELQRFSALVHQLTEDGGWSRPPARVAIVVPENFERDEPTWSKYSREDFRPNLFQSYIAAREADLDVALTWERDMHVGPAPGGPSLFMLPCAKMATTDGVRALLSLARSGAGVYASYFAGNGREQTGPWLPWMNEMFGVDHRLRYGVADRIDDDEVEFVFLTDLGDLPAGSRLHFPVAGGEWARAYLPVEPVSAQVIAVDAHGRPALLRNPDGEGWTMLSTYPLEHMASCRRAANPEDTWRLYAAVAAEAGVPPTVSIPDPRVMVADIGSSGRRKWLAVNICADTVEVAVRSGSLSLRTEAADNLVATLVLGPYEATVLTAAS